MTTAAEDIHTDGLSFIEIDDTELVLEHDVGATDPGNSQLSFDDQTSAPFLGGTLSSTGQMDTSPTLSSNPPSKPPNQPIVSPLALMSLSYYQPYFDIDTNQVLNRLLQSLFPFKKQFLANDEQPDLYGPFWITTTLIFSVAVTGNLANYISHIHVSSTDVDDSSVPISQDGYIGDITLLTLASMLLYGYLFLGSAAVYILFRYSGSDLGYLESICFYGYSMFVFIIVSILSIFPSNSGRWLVWLIGYCISAFFLFRNVWSRLGERFRAKSSAILTALLIVHFVLVLILKLYFYANIDQPQTDLSKNLEPK